MAVYLFIYNIVQQLLLLVAWPFIALVVLLTPKYRGRTLARLGLGLAAKVATMPVGPQRFWLHALSVGEVSSVVSLAQALRKSYPTSQIIFSTTTRSGADHARQCLASEVDCFIHFPFDHLLVVRYFLGQIRPDLFIQVETDFWPNFLHCLAAEPTKVLLVNGRISATTFGRYGYLPGFFRHLFNCFDLLSLQTKGDMARMIALGIPAAKVAALGNLKIDAALPQGKDKTYKTRRQLSLPAQRRLLVAGSTHAREEELVLACYQQLRQQFADIFLVLALRDVARGREVIQLATDAGLAADCRSAQSVDHDNGDVLVVDTLGELLHYYQQAHVVFVGGSLVASGGHNPLEPAAFACPVCFGQHMEDFADIAQEMVRAKAAVQLAAAGELFDHWRDLLADEESRRAAGQRAKDFIAQRQGVTARHLAAIVSLLGR